MFSCIDCQHGLSEMDLQKQKCLNCQREKIAEINEFLWKISEQNQREAKLHEEMIRKQKERIKQYWEIINGPSRDIMVSREEISNLRKDIDTCQETLDELFSPNPLEDVLQEAANRAGEQSPREKCKKREYPDQTR